MDTPDPSSSDGVDTPPSMPASNAANAESTPTTSAAPAFSLDYVKSTPLHDDYRKNKMLYVSQVSGTVTLTTLCDHFGDIHPMPMMPLIYQVGATFDKFNIMFKTKESLDLFTDSADANDVVVLSNGAKVTFTDFGLKYKNYVIEGVRPDYSEEDNRALLANVFGQGRILIRHHVHRWRNQNIPTSKYNVKVAGGLEFASGTLFAMKEGYQILIRTNTACHCCYQEGHKYKECPLAPSAQKDTPGAKRKKVRPKKNLTVFNLENATSSVMITPPPSPPKEYPWIVQDSSKKKSRSRSRGRTQKRTASTHSAKDATSHQNRSKGSSHDGRTPSSSGAKYFDESLLDHSEDSDLDVDNEAAKFDNGNGPKIGESFLPPNHVMDIDDDDQSPMGEEVFTEKHLIWIIDQIKNPDITHETKARYFESVPTQLKAECIARLGYDPRK